MTKTYKKKDENTLIVTCVENSTKIIEESRDEIQSQLNRLELEKSEIQKRIDEAQVKITILDA